MATNEILTFADSGSANVLSQVAYDGDADRPLGHQPGIARAQLENKALRQVSLMAAGLAQYIADNQAVNITDSLTPANIAAYLEDAFAAGFVDLTTAQSVAGVKTFGSTPVLPTPAQFNNSTGAATTAFVQRAIGNTRASTTYSATASLTLSDIGKDICFTGSTASQTITLPAVATVSSGGAIWFTNQATVNVTLKGNASENITANTLTGASSANTLVLKPGDSVYVVSNASSWRTHGITATNQFPVSLGSDGYVKLPNGFIIQWLVVACVGAAVTTVSLPLTFPTIGTAAVIAYSSATAQTSAQIPTTVNIISTSQITVAPNSTASGNRSYYCIVVGY